MCIECISWSCVHLHLLSDENREIYFEKQLAGNPRDGAKRLHSYLFCDIKLRRRWMICMDEQIDQSDQKSTTALPIWMNQSESETLFIMNAPHVCDNDRAIEAALHCTAPMNKMSIVFLISIILFSNVVSGQLNLYLDFAPVHDLFRKWSSIIDERSSVSLFLVEIRDYQLYFVYQNQIRSSALQSSLQIPAHVHYLQITWSDRRSEIDTVRLNSHRTPSTSPFFLR